MSAFAGSPRRHGRPTLTRFLIAAAGAALGLAAAAPAAPPDPLPRATGRGDLELTLRVKSALEADPALKGLNPVVSVVDRVAVVGGPAPSDAAIARLTDVLRTVPGLTDARVRCWVETPDDPLKTLAAARIKADAAAAGLPPATALPGPPAPPVAGGPVAFPPSTVVALDPRPAGTVVAQRAVPPVGAFLMDPVAPRSGRTFTPPAAAPYPTIPAPAVPVRPNQDLAAAVEDVRRADPRFAGLTAVVRGDKVVIAGRAADGDAWDLAAVVRRVPGVGRVAFGRVDAR